jgi:hypothetical protein
MVSRRRLLRRVDVLNPRSLLLSRLADGTTKYARFRHLFLHTYDFRLDHGRRCLLAGQWKSGRAETIWRTLQLSCQSLTASRKASGEVGGFSAPWLDA